MRGSASGGHRATATPTSRHANRVVPGTFPRLRHDVISVKTCHRCRARRYHVRVGTIAPTRPQIDDGTGTGLGRPWHVIVCNDDHNTFEGVARTLAAVLPGVSLSDGLALAERIHLAGQEVVWSGHQELAELYHEQLAARGLTMAPLEQH